MCPARPKPPARRTSPTRTRLRWAASLVTVTAVGSLVLGQAPVEPSPAAPSGGTSIQMVAATKV